MLEDVLSLERELFLAINNAHSPLLDNALWLYSGWLVWVPFIILFLFALIYKKPRRVWLPVLVSLLLLVATCLVVSDVVLKPYFARLRPTYHPDFMNEVKYLFNYKGEGLYGFVSGHSTFSFAFAIFTTLLFRYKPFSFIIYAWAVVMVYSRVYLGVHFLTDILGGMVAGTLTGLGVFYLFSRIKEDYRSYYSNRRKLFITIGLVCYVLLLVVFSEQIVAEKLSIS